MKFKRHEPENVRRKRKYDLHADRSYVVLWGDRCNKVGILHRRFGEAAKSGYNGESRVPIRWDFEYARDRWIENFNGTLTYMSLGNDKDWRL